MFTNSAVRSYNIVSSEADAGFLNYITYDITTLLDIEVVVDVIGVQFQCSLFHRGN